MESGRTYTENELGEKRLLEREIKFIFNRDYISKALVKSGNRLIERWKKLVEWKEDDVPFLKED